MSTQTVVRAARLDRAESLMTPVVHALRAVLVGLALTGAWAGVATTLAQSPAPEDTRRAVQRALERLPYYGVFDYLVFRLDGATVHLAGYSFDGRLNEAAAMAVKRVGGVAVVSDRIEVMPVSSHDDSIRWATYYRIYTDDFLSRYVPGGVPEVLREIRDERRFPGMQPVSRYPIHIIVKNGRTMLLGSVDTAADRQIAEVRAREVSGVFEVENAVTVDQ
jgi:hyperosmotically inducible periplasmic protein